MHNLRSSFGKVLDVSYCSSHPLIVYFLVNRHATLQTGGPPFIVASRTLARLLLIKHLMQLEIPVHVFENLEDPSWLKYEAMKKVATANVYSFADE